MKRVTPLLVIVVVLAACGRPIDARRNAAVDGSPTVETATLIGGSVESRPEAGTSTTSPKPVVPAVDVSATTDTLDRLTDEIDALLAELDSSLATTEKDVAP